MRIPVVDRQDQILGMEERSKMHTDGLICRVVNIWLVTPEKEFIFQKRGPDQDTWPGRWDVTAGGHVDFIDETYEACAYRELLEETGLHVPIQFFSKVYSESYEPNKAIHHNAFRSTFIGIFEGNLEDIQIEEGHGLGFNKFSLDFLLNVSEEDRKNFIPRFFEEDSIKMFQEILTILFK